jgi:hypothetical protein
VNFDKKWIGLHFGRYFHKLTWSPCPAGAREEQARAEAKEAMGVAEVEQEERQHLRCARLQEQVPRGARDQTAELSG